MHKNLQIDEDYFTKNVFIHLHVHVHANLTHVHNTDRWRLKILYTMFLSIIEK